MARDRVSFLVLTRTGISNYVLTVVYRQRVQKLVLLTTNCFERETGKTLCLFINRSGLKYLQYYVIADVERDAGVIFESHLFVSAHLFPANTERASRSGKNITTTMLDLLLAIVNNY